MDTELDFKAFLSDKLRERGMTLKRLSEISGIAVKHLESIGGENTSNLPAAPYLRGYLQRLGKVLDFNPEPWWEYFRKKENLKSSGPGDELPKNRFARQPVGKQLFLTALLAVVVLFFGLRLEAILGKPEIELNSPAEVLALTSLKTLTVSGQIKGGDKLTINTEAVTVGSDGTFSKVLLLQPGLNTIEIAAKKFLGQETRIIRQVLYEPPQPSTSTAEGQKSL